MTTKVSLYNPIFGSQVALLFALSFNPMDDTETTFYVPTPQTRETRVTISGAKVVRPINWLII